MHDLSFFEGYDDKYVLLGLRFFIILLSCFIDFILELFNSKPPYIGVLSNSNFHSNLTLDEINTAVLIRNLFFACGVVVQLLSRFIIYLRLGKTEIPSHEIVSTNTILSIGFVQIFAIIFTVTGKH